PELIRDLLEFRRIFGREIARLAAVRAAKEPEALARLKALADRGDTLTTAGDLFELDFEFYVVVTQLAQNHVMLLLINTVRDGVRNFTALLANLAAPQVDVRRHHRELIAAIEAADATLAARIADDYLRLGAELAGRFDSRPALQPLPLPL
ncbi:MAG: FCD domain-containing protein, partial [Proteobacteria bacterium]|nr:FCD domain-containing protein [Pseudomonadota bacterium]